VSKGNYPFKESDLARTVRAGRKAGLTDFTARVITPDGRVFEISCGEAAGQAAVDLAADEWKVGSA
jgi:hypothetical protein